MSMVKYRIPLICYGLKAIFSNRQSIRAISKPSIVPKVADSEILPPPAAGNILNILRIKIFLGQRDWVQGEVLKWFLSHLGGDDVRRLPPLKDLGRAPPAAAGCSAGVSIPHMLLRGWKDALNFLSCRVNIMDGIPSLSRACGVIMGIGPSDQPGGKR